MLPGPLPSARTQQNRETRQWKVLCWNVRGLNSDKKWNAIRNKITEAQCDIFCLQETKRDFFDLTYIKNFAPLQFDNFEYLPSVGASGGILVAWKGSCFAGELIMSNDFSITIEFTSLFSGAKWKLITYAPCTDEGKLNFLNWPSSIDMEDDCD